MRKLTYYLCILFVGIILVSITSSTLEGYTSYADKYKAMDASAVVQDTLNKSSTKESNRTEIEVLSVGATIMSSEYPFKMGKVTRIPPNSYSDVEVTYPRELTPRSVKRDTITVISDPTKVMEQTPYWMTTSKDPYKYDPFNLSKYKTISSKDDIYTPNSQFKDERYTYDLSGNSRYTGRPTAYVSNSSWLKEDELYSVWKPEKKNIVSNIKSKIGQWFNPNKPTNSLDKSTLIAENDVLADYTSPPILKNSKQDPMGYTADSSTLNKINQTLNSLVMKNHCDTSAFGCCKDKLTAKRDMVGSNCSEAIVVGLSDDVKKYIDTSISEKTFSFTPSTSALLQSSLPPTDSNTAAQKSYTNTVFLTPPKGVPPPPGSCPQSSFDSKITPTYSNVESTALPLPLLSDFSQFT